MNKLTALVAKIGTNPYWIAFAVMMMLRSKITSMVVIAIIAVLLLVAAAVKEFYFDARNEVPKQTPFDNWTDFGGYGGGIAAALLCSALLWIWFVA